MPPPLGATPSAGIRHRRDAADALFQVLAKLQPLNLSDGDTRESRDYGFIKASLNLCLRHLGEIDATLFELIKNPAPLRRHYALMILRLATTELLFMDRPPYAVLNSWVQVARQNRRARHFAPLINGVLRELTRRTDIKKHRLEINTPPWLWQEWLATYGAPTAHKIAEAHLQEAPIDLSWAGSPPEVEGRAIGIQTWRLAQKAKIETLAGFQSSSASSYWVQDVAATLPAHLFGDIKNARVLEVGAAPGGKSAQLAALGAKLTALDSSPERAVRWSENQKRLGFDAELVIADGETYRAPTPFPFILIDAPCSGTGTIRRHPELPWLRTPKQLKALQKTQAALLCCATKNLARGGILIYAVCSLQQSEGLDIINHYLAQYPSMERKPIHAQEVGEDLVHLLTKTGDVRSLPFHQPKVLKGENENNPDDSFSSGSMDGFFIARLQRTT